MKELYDWSKHVVPTPELDTKIAGLRGQLRNLKKERNYIIHDMQQVDWEREKLEQELNEDVSGCPPLKPSELLNELESKIAPIENELKKTESELSSARSTSWDIRKRKETLNYEKTIVDQILTDADFQVFATRMNTTIQVESANQRSAKDAARNEESAKKLNESNRDREIASQKSARDALVNSLKPQLDSQQQQLNNLMQQYETEKDNLNREIEQIKKTVQDADQNIKQAQKEVDSLTAESRRAEPDPDVSIKLATAQSQLTAYMQQKSNAETQLSFPESRLKSLESNLESNKSTYESEIHKLQDQIRNAKQNATAQIEEIAERYTKIIKKNDEAISKHEGDASRAASNIRDAEKDLEIAQRYHGMQDPATTIKDEIKQTEEAYKVAEDKRSKLAIKVDQLKANLTEAQDAYETQKEKETAAHQKSYDDSRAAWRAEQEQRIYEKGQEVATWTAPIKEAQNKCNAVQEQLNAVKAERDKINQDVRNKNAHLQEIGVNHKWAIRIAIGFGGYFVLYMLAQFLSEYNYTLALVVEFIGVLLFIDIFTGFIWKIAFKMHCSGKRYSEEELEARHAAEAMAEKEEQDARLEPYQIDEDWAEEQKRKEEEQQRKRTLEA